MVNGLLYASSTPLLGDAARRRRRSWPGRATNVFSECYRLLYAPAKTSDGHGRRRLTRRLDLYLDPR